MKVYLAVPTYGGIRHAAFLDSLEATFALLKQRGHDAMVGMRVGCCYIQAARNELLREFLQTDCDTLVYLDDDVSWRAEDALRLLVTPGEVVAGIYPFKAEEEGYPVVVYTDAADRAITRGDGCIRARGVPAGFLKIERSAIEKLCGAYPQQRYSQPIAGVMTEGFYDLFPQGVHNGRWVGEDFGFCRLWEDIGGEIWVLPDLDLCHHGAREFRGNYHQFLMRCPGGSEDGGSESS